MANPYASSEQKQCTKARARLTEARAQLGKASNLFSAATHDEDWSLAVYEAKSNIESAIKWVEEARDLLERKSNV